MIKSLFRSGSSLYIFYLGIENAKTVELTSASIALMGSIFPVLLISIVLFFSNSGIKSLRNKTDAILEKYVPNSLAFVPDNLQSINDVNQEKADIESNHIKGIFYADYKISFIDKGVSTDNIHRKVEMIIRVELNVKRVNFNLYIPKNRIEEFAHTHNIPLEDKDGILRHMFPHCVNTQEVALGDDMIFYHYNSSFLERRFGDKEYFCLVGSSRLSTDLLWSSSETLYFSQDLTLMVRAFYQENKQLFWL